MVTAAPPSKVAGSPRSDDDKAGPSCRPIVLLLGPTQTDRKKFRVGAENAVLQPADTGRVARAFRAARDRQAVPQGPHRRLRESRRHQVRIGLFAGGRRIRTLSPTLMTRLETPTG